jgi:hypothetical protein
MFALSEKGTFVPLTTTDKHRRNISAKQRENVKFAQFPSFAV